MFYVFYYLYAIPLQLVQGSPSTALPVPIHFAQTTSLVIELFPFPLQTMQGTLAPKGFLPVPAQKTQGLKGAFISTTANPLQTWHFEISESN
ncbi:hypothetical protein PI23P_02352 [Polaribacter irgensii 23-P]|uniref:Uncharacterized protein n=1 Tax=Polaribacter irgensii 23-P TaxID=313594 RepID=A4BWF7_9FLAO|nr:hypothetical protein PI23P_02352 [Polaribacter irgensii 23-P]